MSDIIITFETPDPAVDVIFENTPETIEVTFPSGSDPSEVVFVPGGMIEIEDYSPAPVADVFVQYGTAADYFGVSAHSFTITHTADGMIDQVTYANGVILTYLRGNSGVYSIVSNKGHVKTFTRNGDGEITSVIYTNVRDPY